MDDFETLDWYTNPDVHQDPYPYVEFLRGKGPAVYLPQHNAVAVTDYEEALRIFRDDENYSSITSGNGPFPPLPFTPDSEDISAQLDEYGPQMPASTLLTSLDRPQHASHRALLMGVITPKRLKDNEDFIWRLSDQQIGIALEKGKFEAVNDLGHPLSVLVVADLLGVPEGEHERFLDMLPSATQIGGRQYPPRYNPLEALGEALSEFIVDRRTTPRDDVMTDLARAKFPDGSTPEIKDVVTIAAFLFAAGQDTVVRLLGSSLQIIGDNPDIQQMLRADRDRLPAFIEEVLRLESPVKADHRLTRVRTRIGDLDVAAGTHVMLMLGGINRDPNRFERPNDFIMDRPNVRDHLAFGRGNHACAGAPLARSEARIALHRLLDRTSDIRISETDHGPIGARRYEYPPRYTMRGPKELYVEVTPA